MKKLMTIAVLLIFCSVFGQNKTHHNITKPNGDSTYWFKHVTERIKKLSLPRLDTSSRLEYIRIWTNRQAVDIYQTENGNFSANLTTWTDEYVGGDEKPTNRTFTKTKHISYDTVRLLRELLRANNILAIPTEDSIPGWGQGFDGIIYLIEHSTTNSYSLKSYWSPKAQESLREAVQIQSFVDSVFCLIRASMIWEKFTKEIPFECYYNGGPGVACRILTESQRKTYHKERQHDR